MAERAAGAQLFTSLMAVRFSYVRFSHKIDWVAILFRVLSVKMSLIYKTTYLKGLLC